MTRKKIGYFLLLAVLSVLILLLPVRLGGAPFGHHHKFVAVAVLYAMAGFICFHFLFKTRDRWVASAIFLVPVVIVYGTLHFGHFEDTLLSAPSSLAHIFGFLVGTGIRSVKRLPLRVGVLMVFLLFLAWTHAFGYQLWLNKLKFGSFLLRVEEEVPRFTLHAEDGQPFSNAQLDDKIVIFDFWTTSCGICFRKFPILDDLHKKYADVDDVAFFAVNIPLKNESNKTRKKALGRIQSSYSFRMLFAEHAAVADSFKILGYPTVLVLDGSAHVIYRGDIENVDDVISAFR